MGICVIVLIHQVIFQDLSNTILWRVNMVTLHEGYELTTNTVKDLMAFSWIGDTVVWRDFEYRNSSFYLNMLRNRSIGFVGDSLSRRLCFTLVKFLGGATGHVLNDDYHGLHIRNHTTYFDNDLVVECFWVPLLEDFVVNYTHDFVFISLGLHDAIDRHTIDLDRLFFPIETISNYYFRTPPYPDRGAPYNSTILDSVLKRAREMDESKIVDTNRLLLGRDRGKNRIGGNTNYHFGLQGRLGEMFMVLHFLENKIL